MEIDYAEIGEKIFNLRTSKKPKVSREKLAEAVGVTSTSVYRWEKGIDRPELKNITAVAKFFGVPLSFLIKEDPVHSPTQAPPQPQESPKDYVTKGDLEELQNSLIKKLMEVKKLMEGQKVTELHPHYGSIELSKDELRLVRGFRGLSDKGQKLLLKQLDIIFRNHPKPPAAKGIK